MASSARTNAVEDVGYRYHRYGWRPYNRYRYYGYGYRPFTTGIGPTTAPLLPAVLPALLALLVVGGSRSI